MKTVWLSKDEVCTLTGWTERHLLRLARTGAVAKRASSTTYRGQAVNEYELSSLPEDARRKYLDSHQPEPAPEIPAASPSPLALAAPAPAPSQKTRVALPPDAEKQATERLAIIKPLIEYLRDGSTHATTHQLALADGELVQNSDALARYLAEQHGISAATIWRWYSAFQKGGAIALARKPRADKNRSTWAAENRELADLAAYLYMGNADQPPQSVRIAWEQVCERAGGMGVPKPSYETVRSFLRNPAEVSPSMLTYNRMGRKKYEATFAPWMGRKYSEPANSIWVSDHMIHDVYCQNDVFGDRDLGHIRLQMTTILDYRSRYVVGVSWCENGSSHTIKRALLHAFTEYGLPDLFYCDNGKDFRNIGKGARPQDWELLAMGSRACLDELGNLRTGVLQRVGVEVKYCLPYHPQSKHVERYHRTVHERWDKKFTTYTAGASHLRPDMAAAALARHGKLLQMGRAVESDLPLASQFIAACEHWIHNWYHQQPLDGEGMEGLSPADAFAKFRRPVERACPEISVLAMLLCERETRMVRNCAVDLRGARFVTDVQDHAAYVLMHERSGRRVIVAFDPMEPLFAAVLDEDGHFLCRLQREDLMEFSGDATTREKVHSFISNRNSLAKAVRTSTQDLGKRVRANGYTTLQEQALALPAAVGDVVVQKPEAPRQAEPPQRLHSEQVAARFLTRMNGGSNGAHR